MKKKYIYILITYYMQWESLITWKIAFDYKQTERAITCKESIWLHANEVLNYMKKKHLIACNGSVSFYAKGAFNHMIINR